MRKIHILLVFLFVSISWSYASVFVSFNHKDLTYMGRIEKVKNRYAAFYWPGTSVTINFRGTGINAVMKNGREECYYYAIVDGNDSTPLKFRADTLKSVIELAKGLKDTTHTVQIFKLSNNTSYTWFYGFELTDGSKVLKADRLPARKIEFFGNSITAGHGVDVLPKDIDSGSPFYFNNYRTYATITARHFNAQYHCTARSGIGILISWFPEIMPEIYDRVNPANPASKWDFSKFTPDIVVINLFQNDKWLTGRPNFEQFKARFGTTAPDEATIIKAYQNFVKTIRSKYPNAYIICALGSMDATEEGSLWPGYIEQAVKGIDDPKILTHFFPYKKTPGHPKVAEQKVMADSLINFIEKNIKW